LPVFFGKAFFARVAREALLVIGATLSLNAFAHKNLCAFYALVSIANDGMARLAIGLFLEGEIASGESNFAPRTPETALVPEMPH